MTPSVLVVSDNEAFSLVVAEQVRQELGFACTVAGTVAMPGKPGLQPVAEPTLVISDGEAGQWPCPVIKVKEKPLRLHDLLAEISAMVQKTASPEVVRLAGGYQLYCRQKQLAHEASGGSVDVTDKEMQLLMALAEAGAAGMSKEALLQKVWGFDAAVQSHTLETHIYRLRGKLKELAGSEHVIMAMDGGYKIAV